MVVLTATQKLRRDVDDHALVAPSTVRTDFATLDERETLALVVRSGHVNDGIVIAAAAGSGR